MTKEMKLKFKKLYSAWKWLANQTRLIWHWIRNLFFVFFTTKSTVRIFEGYGHWWFAKKYADRRAKMSKINEVCGEKRHFVLPWGNYSLIVLNKIELNTLKSKGIINKKLNVLEIFKHAYYLTK